MSITQRLPEGTDRLTLPFCLTGTPVTRVTATDADDPVYGNSAKLVYSILEGQPYFSIDPNSGKRCFVQLLTSVNTNVKVAAASESDETKGGDSSSDSAICCDPTDST